MPRTPPDDDAALRWDDIDDSSWVEARSDVGTPGAAAETDAGDDVEASRGASDERSGGSFLASLVTAVGAVLYLAYSIAWIVAVGGLQLSGPTLVLEVLYQFAEFLAIIASGLWFVTTLVLTPGRVGRRAGWLALGLLVLLPWPFVLGVVA